MEGGVRDGGASKVLGTGAEGEGKVVDDESMEEGEFEGEYIIWIYHVARGIQVDHSSSRWSWFLPEASVSQKSSQLTRFDSILRPCSSQTTTRGRVPAKS